MKPRIILPLLAAVSLVALAFGHAALQAQTRSGNPSGNSSGTRSETRMFPPEKLGELEGPDRDLWQKPEQVMDALGIADGTTVADLGAGGGWFTVRLARRVGPQGVVYAEDVQEQMFPRALAATGCTGHRRFEPAEPPSMARTPRRGPSHRRQERPTR